MLVRAATGAWPSNYASQTVNGLTAGETYTFSAKVWVPTGAVSEWKVRIGSVTDGTTTGGVRDQWVWLKVTFVASGTSHIPLIAPTAGSGLLRGVDRAYVAEAMFEVGNGVNQWFDGDYPDDSAYFYDWEGDQYISPAIQTERFPANQSWILRDTSDPEATGFAEISIAGDLESSSELVGASFAPLGRDRNVVVTDAKLGEMFDNLPLTVRGDAALAQLEDLRGRHKTLLLQSDTDEQWWVRPVGSRGRKTYRRTGRRTDPVHAVTLSLLEVDELVTSG
jgi:hypothetical protein